MTPPAERSAISKLPIPVGVVMPASIVIELFSDLICSKWSSVWKSKISSLVAPPFTWGKTDLGLLPKILLQLKDF